VGKKIHWVGWQKVIKTNEEGGLGLQPTIGRNTALLAKLNWRLHMEKEAPWAQVLLKKYCSPRRLNNINANKFPCSTTWKAIKKGIEKFSKGSRWMVGRESNLKVWHSNWTSKGSLRNMIQGPLSWEANQLEIREFLVDTGWDWSKIPFELPLDIKQVIQATPISLTGRGKDILSWSESP